MKALDENPVARWRSITDFYREFTATPGSEFLAPMVELTAWVAEQPLADPLFPATSHHRLCVDLHPSYSRRHPFFACVTRSDAQFECELWVSWSNKRYKRRLMPVGQAREVFGEFAGLLHELNAQRM